MKRHGNQDPSSYAKLPSLFEGSKNTGPVFPGKPYQVPYENLAVQRSLMEIFDEFTQVISGELKSMNMEQFETERKNQKPPQTP
jgi:hypothetical protein